MDSSQSLPFVKFIDQFKNNNNNNINFSMLKDEASEFGKYMTIQIDNIRKSFSCPS